ncbi:hypothetical protein [Citricoccus sp. I39-566]|uniref:hypothetical protein n=1 Tax=Citricoccus sp. I39-566 TaxID=3073268 RepID=UPI00286C0D46|nr:hypothetical protein [Citricoccus sp. I39-566]WMY79976.1 hypothetical protein RE421_16420 [Citricoccus sp. I39-566]
MSKALESAEMNDSSNLLNHRVLHVDGTRYATRPAVPGSSELSQPGSPPEHHRAAHRTAGQSSPVAIQQQWINK